MPKFKHSVSEVMDFIESKDGLVDARVSFSLVWFENEEDANTLDEMVRANGWTYNGGIMHGYPLGRDKSWDRPEGSEKRYAVTF